MFYKTLHRKLKIVQHEPHLKLWMESVYNISFNMNTKIFIFQNIFKILII